MTKTLFPLGALAIALALALALGGLPLSEILSHPDQTMIFLHVRLPRVLTVAFAGAALAIGGVLTQGLFRNDLAAPSTLGVSTAAHFAAICALAVFGGMWLHWLAVPTIAVATAILLTALLATASGGFIRGHTGTLLLLGLAINALFGAAAAFVTAYTTTDPTRALPLLSYLSGQFTAKGFEHAGLLFIVFGFAMVCTLPAGKSLDRLALGEDIAQNLGIDRRNLTTRLTLIVGLVDGAVAAFAGMLPFVSLIVPIAARRLHGPHHRTLLLLAPVYGATLVLLADAAGRYLFLPASIDVGIITGLVGAPVFLAILLRRGVA
jgi:iron complex transport system permease protein